METFINGLTLSEITFKMLFIIYFIYSTKQQEKEREEFRKRYQQLINYITEMKGE